MIIFSYGSNMHPGRLKARVPSTLAINSACICGYTLRFHKISLDGSAKADAYFTNHEHDIIWGVLYKINPNEKRSLDLAEGLGNGYHEKFVHATDPNGYQYKAQIYFADEAHISTNLSPYGWYKNFVLKGAQHHELPEEYIQRIALIKSICDPNLERDHNNRMIISNQP